VIYIVGMWCCWGTLNFRTVARHHRDRQAVDAAYDEVYLRKETLLYHLDWARQRGDRAEVKTLEAQMAGIDRELNEVETKLRALDSSAQRSSKSSSKHA
jgi:Skp family chaperone for outer membrane proteins